jgi:hypothetical protein
MIKKQLIQGSLVCLGLLCLIAALISYYQLDRTPYGFHVDEFTGSVNIGCMATEGVDAHGIHYPLFAITGYGTPKPPTYIYPGIIWAKFFGYSAPSLRALSVTVHLLGIAGLFFLAEIFFGWRYALICITLASISPWTWGLSRVAFESLFSVTFIIWGLCLFFKRPTLLNTILSGFFFVAAIYSYPPFRLVTPLMILTLIIYSQWKNPRTFSSWLVFAFSLIAPVIPLVQKTLTGEIQKRFDQISIFSRDYLNAIHSPGHWGDIAGIFINNYWQHFSWDFLILTGDPSYVHSTRHFGILSWLDVAALMLAFIWLCLLLMQKYVRNNPLIVQKYFIIFLIINILIGVLPAALTNSELPNSLRITGSWPFVCLLSGYLLWQACELWWGSWVAIALMAVIFAGVYFNVYFRVFPQEGKGMFAYWTLEEANQLKTEDDWMKFVYVYRYKDYSARYFLMQYHGLSCSQSMDMWEGMGKLLKSRGLY